jgi:hypothetical protein
MFESELEVTKTGEDHYHVFANNKVLHIEEDVDGPKLMAMLWLTSEELLALFDMKPIGHKVSVPYKKQ